jgi:hypothetical protein
MILEGNGLRLKLRWLMAYSLSLVLATIGVVLTAATFGDLLSPIVGRAIVIDLQIKPPYILELGAGFLTGYLASLKWKGSYAFWVWIPPTAFLILGVVGWMKLGSSPREAVGHFFSDSCWPLCDDQVYRTMPTVGSAAYSLGALLQRTVARRATEQRASK